MMINSNDDDKKWAYLLWGHIYKSRGDLTNAIDKYKQSLVIDPQFPGANNSLGWSYYAQKDYLAARECFRTSRLKEPKNFVAINGIAITSRYLGEANEAEKAYKLNIELFPDEIFGYGNYTDFLMAVKKDTAAVSELWIEGSKRIPKSSNYFTAIGGNYFFKNQKDSALYYFNKALEYDPDNVSALQALIEINVQDNNYDKSKSYIKRYIQVLQNQKYEASMLQLALNRLSLIEQSHNELDSALLHANMAIEVNQLSPFPWSTLAETYLLKKDLTNFYKYLEKAISQGFEVENYQETHPYVLVKNDPRFQALIKMRTINQVKN
jgi:tetratricopeptide (TPR) repeat protein